MAEPRQGSPLRELLAFVGAVAAISVALAALGLLPTRRLAGPEGVRAMVSALAVVAIASLIGAVPVHLARLGGRPRPQVVMVSMLVRLAVVGVLSLLLALAQDLVLAPFLTWLVIAYLALLVVDSLYAIRALGEP